MSVTVSGAGINMEGLLYFRKCGIGGPEFKIKEELVTERGRQLFQALSWTREACCAQEPYFGGLFHRGGETIALRQHQRTND